MDWDRAISRNSEAIGAIVSALFALLLSARLNGAGLMAPRHVWRSILFVLRPAEAAVRRLIMIAARSLARVAFTPRQRLSGAPFPPPRAVGASVPLFDLFDPLKRGWPEEEEEGGCGTAGFFRRDGDDAPVNAAHLHRRLRALRHALADLSAQARRLVRFNARRDALLMKAGRPARWSPMRPGLPPGWRERGKHEIDTVLKECHRLVRYLDDTS